MGNNTHDPDVFTAVILLILFALLGAGLLCLTWNHRATLQSQIKLFLCALSARFLMSIVIYEFGLVNILKDEDASGWTVGASIYKEWVSTGCLALARQVIGRATRAHQVRQGCLIHLLRIFTGSKLFSLQTYS